MPRRPVYFESADALRRWFARHAKTETELVVGYMKKGTGMPSSNWSNINIRRVATLKAERRMKAAGLAAFAARDKRQPPRGSYEQMKQIRLPRKDLARIRANAAAWKYYRRLPPGYLRMCAWWIISAKKPETRARRLEAFIAKCAARSRFTW